MDPFDNNSSFSNDGSASFSDSWGTAAGECQIPAEAGSAFPSFAASSDIYNSSSLYED